jgi:hypothetical protein
MGIEVRGLLALATAVTVALVAALTAAAEPRPTWTTQYANNTALDCLKASSRSGVLSVTSAVWHQSSRKDKAGINLDYDYDLTISFQPNSSAQPSYTGSMRVSEQTLIPYGTVSLNIPLSIALQGSDGSTATLIGVQTLLINWTSDRNAQISIADGGWDCAPTS